MIAGMGIFLLTPLREGRLAPLICFILPPRIISTHAPAGGATAHAPSAISMAFVFLLTPLREGRPAASAPGAPTANIFLLTPLREGRRKRDGCAMLLVVSISTHAPAGGATCVRLVCLSGFTLSFLLTPLREGRRKGLGGR